MMNNDPKLFINHNLYAENLNRQITLITLLKIKKLIFGPKLSHKSFITSVITFLILLRVFFSYS